VTDVRKTGNDQITRETFVPEKKESGFKTITFLISSEKNKPVTSYSDHRGKDEGDHSKVPDTRGD
jgi:hypothetical protein